MATGMAAAVLGGAGRDLHKDMHVRIPPVEVVQLEALVVLKIVRHCREALPAVVNGQILGMNNEGRLEVTNCFPFPLRESAQDEEDVATYVTDMMRRLRDVNIDHNHVGCYQSTLLGSFVTPEIISTQYRYQSQAEDSVLVVYGTRCAPRLALRPAPRHLTASRLRPQTRCAPRTARCR